MEDPDKARRVAILIGQNRFPKAEHLTDLAYAEADMAALAEQLTAAPGVPYDQVVQIPTGPSYQALETMEHVAAELKHQDTLLIFYSGHGLLDKTRRLNLAFENTNEKLLTSTALKVGQVLDLFRAGLAKSRVLVLDCCYAGGVGAEFDRSSLPQQIETEVHGTGTVVLTSATKAQVARENPDYGHGIFTKHLLDGLAGAADHSGNGTVTTQELYEYVHARVTAESGQRPQRFNHETEGQIVLHHTGLTPWKDKADAIVATLKKLNGDHQLSDRLFLQTFTLAKKPPQQMSALDRQRFKMLEDITAGTFRSGAFENAWEALETENDEPPEPQIVKPEQPHYTKRPQDPPPRPGSPEYFALHPEKATGASGSRASGSEQVLELLQSGQDDDVKKHLPNYWDTAPAAKARMPPPANAQAPDGSANITLMVYALGGPLILAIWVGVTGGGANVLLPILALGFIGLSLGRTGASAAARWRKWIYRALGGLYLAFSALVIIALIIGY